MICGVGKILNRHDCCCVPDFALQDDISFVVSMDCCAPAVLVMTCHVMLNLFQHLTGSGFCVICGVDKILNTLNYCGVPGLVLQDDRILLGRLPRIPSARIRLLGLRALAKSVVFARMGTCFASCPPESALDYSALFAPLVRFKILWILSLTTELETLRVSGFALTLPKIRFRMTRFLLPLSLGEGLGVRVGCI